MYPKLVCMTEINANQYRQNYFSKICSESLVNEMQDVDMFFFWLCFGVIFLLLNSLFLPFFESSI